MKNHAKIWISCLIVAGLAIIAGSMYISPDDKTPAVAFVYPSGNETMATGSAQKIIWDARNIPADYKIAVNIRRLPPPPLQEEGQEFDPIIFTNLPNTGSADWVVGDMYPAGKYVLGITAYAITNSTIALWLSSDLGYSDQQALGLVAAWSLSMTAPGSHRLH